MTRSAMSTLVAYEQIKKGLRTGIPTHKFGANSDIDGAAEDLWEVGGSYTGWATAAETLEIFSTSADDDEDVIIYGLDANWNYVSETVTMTGDVGVTTTNSYIRSWRGKWIGDNDVVGTITCRQSTTTANVMWTITAGNNQTLVSAFSTRAGYAGLLVEVGASLSKSIAAVSSVEIFWRNSGAAFNLKDRFKINSAGNNRDGITYQIPRYIEPQSDIIVRADSSAQNNEVSAWFDIVETPDFTRDG